MSRVLITTIGTSLLTNRDERPWAGWNGRNGDPLPDAVEVDRWLDQAEPAAASAETNTLRALELTEQDRVVLLHSDTSEGRFCTERLAAYLNAGRCRSAELRPLIALGYHAGGFAQRGLRSLVSEAVKAIKEARSGGLEPVLCATGGFKAEIAFLNLLGALLQVEVCYIHEHFREMVRLPRLPLTWDAAFVEHNLDFFTWIDDEPRPSVEVENWLKGRPELRPLVEDDADGCTYLSAAGHLLFQAGQEQLASGPRITWPDPSPVPPKEKYGLSGVEHHRPRGWESFVARLCEIDCVSRVVYDAAAAAGHAIKILDAATGKIGIRYGSGDQMLPLAVLTTATGEAQTQLVVDYIRDKIKIGRPGEPHHARSAIMTCTSPAQANLTADAIRQVLHHISILPCRVLLETPGVAATVPMLRGVWGAALWEMDRATYDRVFEGIGGSDSTVPHEKTPLYILRPALPDPAFAPAMEWILLGQAVPQGRVLAEAWQRAAEAGLGPQRRPFKLRQWLSLAPDGRQAEKRGPWRLGQCAWPCEQPETTACQVRFDSPLRLRRRGRLIEKPSLADLVVAAARRVGSFLAAVELPAWKSLEPELLAWARQTPEGPWRGERLDLVRYSGRQRRELDLHGVCGSLTLPEGPGPLWPLLAAASWLHLGKGTVMGMGQPNILLNP